MSSEHAASTAAFDNAKALQASLDTTLAHLKEDEAKQSRAAQRARAAAKEADEAQQRALETYDQAEANAGRAIAELRTARNASLRTARVMEKRTRKASRADARARRAQIQSEARAEALENAAKEQRALEVQHWPVEQLLVPPLPDAPAARLNHLVAALQARVDALPDLPALEELKLPAPEPLKPENDDVTQRVETIRRENEDLLVLLEDLTQKRKADKAVLRAHGHEVSDDSDEE